MPRCQRQRGPCFSQYPPSPSLWPHLLSPLQARITGAPGYNRNLLCEKASSVALHTNLQAFPAPLRSTSLPEAALGSGKCQGWAGVLRVSASRGSHFCLIAPWPYWQWKQDSYHCPASWFPRVVRDFHSYYPSGFSLNMGYSLSPQGPQTSASPPSTFTLPSPHQGHQYPTGKGRRDWGC